MHQHDDPKATASDQSVESHEPESSTPPSNVGDHVLDILASVERQFDRLRKVQQGHDAELTSLREHAQTLESAEQEAREELARLREQRVALERERHDVQARETELRERSEQIQAQLQEIEQGRSNLESSQGALDEATAQLQQDRDDQEQRQQEHLNELQRLEDELARDRQTQQEQRTRIEQERNALEQQREQQEQVLTEREAEIERARGDVEQRRQAFQEESDRIRQLEGQVNERSAHLDRQREELESSRQSLEQQVRESRGELEAIQTRTQEIETRTAEQVQAAEAEVEASRTRCEEAKADARILQDEVDDLRTQFEQSEAKRTDAEDKLTLAGDRLSKFASILSEQAPQLERGTAALVMVEHQHDQIKRLTRQLAQARVGGSMEELNRKDERVAELTEALRQARGQAAGNQDIAELESKVAELLEEVNRLRVENEQAKVAAAQAKRELDSRVEQTVRESVSEAAVAEQEARNAELATELEKAQQVLRERDKESEQVDLAQKQQVATLKERVRELSEAVQEARTAPAEGGDEKAAEAMAQLREKARRVNAVAEHLRQRQARLKKMRRLVESSAKGSKSAPKPAPGQHMTNLEQRAADIRELEGQRKQLVDVQAMLESSERAMIRKWARPKAVAAIVWLFILVLMNGAFAWFATNHFFPAEVSATVSLAAQTRGGGKMDEATADSWMTWHEDLITSEMFDNAVAKRMAERRVDDYKTGPAVHKRLNHNLEFEKTDTETFNLTLSGRDRGELTSVLDVVALTLAAESTRQMGKRNDRARAVVQNQRKESGLIRYAAVNQIPISDERMKYLGPVFGVLMAISLLLVLGLYRHLLQAKRVFDEESALIDSGEPVEQE